jgi:parallel beta-helix repeat protein
VVERNNIVIDGNSCMLQGAGSYLGINLTGGENVTVRNAQIQAFYSGIYLVSSSNDSIVGNNVTNNAFGIKFDGSCIYNSISGNNITANKHYGIYLESSSSNSISGNNITASDIVGIYVDSSSSNSISGNTMTAIYNGGIALFSSNYSSVSGNNITASNLYGLRIVDSSNDNISGNSITNNGYGIWLDYSPGNRYYHNNFMDNSQQVAFYSSGFASVWDDGYPSGGNYWSDYNGTDSDGDGIGDTPYVIDANNVDNYPLMSPYEYWCNPIPGDVNRDMTVKMGDIDLICSNFGRVPITLLEKHCDINADNIINMRDIGIACSNFGKHYLAI